jgi:hypothetical protein
MFHVTAKVASTLLIGVAAAAVSTAFPSRIVNAADSCLTEPKGDSAQGKHWYYHIERGTGRHCWYVRGQDDASARADDDKQAASDPAPSPKVNPEAARSFADAHAEISPKVSPQAAQPNSNNAAAAPSVWPAPQAANDAAAGNSAPAQPAPDSALASRWPQSADTAASSPAPQQQPDATLMAADAQDNAVQDNTTNAADTSPPPAASPAPPERPSSSIQKLLMVAFGALTLAGLTGSAVYRLGRRRRRNDWLRERNAWQDAQNPNRPPWVDEPRLHSNQDVADLDDRQPLDDHHTLDDRHVIDDAHALDDRHVREPESDFSLAMGESEAGPDRVEKIEDFLARLTEQLQQELEGTRPHSA